MLLDLTHRSTLPGGIFSSGPACRWKVADSGSVVDAFCPGLSVSPDGEPGPVQSAEGEGVRLTVAILAAIASGAGLIHMDRSGWENVSRVATILVGAVLCGVFVTSRSERNGWHLPRTALTSIAIIAGTRGLAYLIGWLITGKWW